MTFMQKEKNRENLALVLALSRSYQQFIRAITPVFKQAGLTSSQWDVLETLSIKGPLTVNDLLASVLGTSGNMDVIIKNLISAGLVTKSVSAQDRRSRMINLTKAGEAKVQDFYPVHNLALAEIFLSLSITDKRQQVQTLNRLRKKIKPQHGETNDNDEQDAHNDTRGDLRNLRSGAVPDTSTNVAHIRGRD